MHARTRIIAQAILVLLTLALSSPTYAEDPLPSWNEGVRKKAIVDFVTKVTMVGGTDFVAAEDRLAVFDNDGTLWCEKPMYVQLAFIRDRVKELAPHHSDWKSKQPFKALLEDDIATAAKAGEQGLMEMVTETHGGTTPEEFEEMVRKWLATARHPRFKRPYTECIYQPMLEVINYLKKNGFKVYIVSGGGIEFMRPWTRKIYGIPPENVIGSSVKTKYEVRDGKPVLIRRHMIDFIDDGVGKPEGINKFIGRRPVMAFGNSDGDYEMLRYVTSSKGPSLGMIIHHTDAEREYAYDRHSPIGRLVRGLDDAAKYGWYLADMKNDWKVIFPPEK